MNIKDRDPEKKEWTIEIRPKKRLLDIDLKGLWLYRDLFYMYVKRDIITVYKQTILGPLWFLIQPILTTIMYMFVFGGLAGISTDGVPQSLFYMSGILLWNYFNTVFMLSSNIFIANANIFGKVYFPRLVVPLSGIASNLVKLGIHLCLFIVIYLYYYIQGADLTISWTVLLFPFLIFMIAFHAMSWGLIISALTTKYRDFDSIDIFWYTIVYVFNSCRLSIKRYATKILFIYIFKSVNTNI